MGSLVYMRMYTPHTHTDTHTHTHTQKPSYRNPSPDSCRHSCFHTNTYKVLSAELVVILIFSAPLSFLSFPLLSMSSDLCAGKNNKYTDVLFSRRQMHKYIKKSHNANPLSGISECVCACVRVCVCVQILVILPAGLREVNAGEG